MSKELLESALKYRDKYGFSVIPLLNNKRPAIKWEEFQKRKANDKELEAWFTDTENNIMIGIVTGAISNLTVIDMDSEEAKISLDGILPDDFLSPTVKTPRGYHYYCNYKVGVRNRAKVLDGVDIRSEGGYVVAPPSVNEAGHIYVWDWNKGFIIDRPDVPDAILTLQCTDNIELNTADEMFTQGRRDEDLFHTANVLVKGGMEVEKISKVMEILARNCTPPFQSKDVFAKVKSAIERGLRRERNLVEEVRGWIMSSSGAFLSSDVARCLQLSSREDLKNLSQILNRLKDSELIEKAGHRAGMFRRIEKDYVIMDWKNAKIQPLDITYPLGIHNICNTYSKNIVVIAGGKDDGKTAFMFDFIKRNQNKFPINYFTNEMGEEEVKLRLTMHEDMTIDDWNFKAYEVGNTWEDIVQPDEITIVDYLEMGGEALYMIGDVIKRMHEKLNKGVLLLGIQKNKGAELGVGKEFTWRRPRIYVTLDSGIATLMSVKNKKPELKINPKGWICEYEIQDGWKIIPKTKWHQEN